MVPVPPLRVLYTPTYPDLSLRARADDSEGYLADADTWDGVRFNVTKYMDTHDSSSKQQAASSKQQAKYKSYFVCCQEFGLRCFEIEKETGMSPSYLIKQKKS